MKYVKTTYYQLIPAKVYKELSTIESLLSKEIKGFSSDNLKQVISIVAYNTRKNEGSAQLQLAYIKKLVAQGDRYLKGLIELNIIQRSGNAIKGHCSYQYNFAPEYYSKYISLSLKNPKLILRIEKAKKEFQKNVSKSIRGHSEQVKYLKVLTVAPEYNEFIKTNYSRNIDKFNSMVSSATRINNNDIFYSLDSTSGRFHSNITNMAKELRPFLRINDESLVNIDIKNSQPFLSTILLTNPSKVSYLTKNPAFTLLLQSLKVSLSQDVKKYISLVVSGQIYEYLMNEFLKEGLKLTRDETKVQVLRILFARNRSPQNEINKKARNIFKVHFPKVHKIFSKIRGSAKGDKFNNYKRFAILLQRIESHLMLDVILKRIYKELPGTIAVTIHDSIMTGVLTNNVKAVKEIMIDELTNFVGLKPNIKIEDYSNRINNSNITTFSKQYVATTFVNIN
jgi:hypothetical protein